MQLIRVFIFSLFLFQAVICQAISGELNFKTTSKGITDALTNQQETPSGQSHSMIKTRGIKTRELKLDSQGPKLRGITIVRKKGNEIQKSKVMVSDQTAYEGVHLKIVFDTDSSSIRPESFPLLNELGKAITGPALANIPIFIKGHTDSIGQEDYNLNLSITRAQSVKTYLIRHFNLTCDVEIMGFGESLPLVPNNCAKNRQINRRVEISTTPI